LPQPIDEETENEGEGEQSEQQGDPQDGDGKGKQSSGEFDESSDDSDDSGDEDSENNGESEEPDTEDSSNPGSEESDTEDSGEQGDSEQESPENNDSDGQDKDGESEEEDSEEDSDNESDSDSGDDSDNEDGEEQSEPIGEPGQDIKDALNKAAKEVEQMMGGIRAGTSESMVGSKGESELAELYTAIGNNPRLAQLMAMIGRMQISQHYLNGVSYAQTQTPVSITMGRDIRNVLPQDLGLLLGGNEEFNVFAAKYNNNELLQKQLKAETKAGKGPMIVCLDESGSMMGDKTTWASSITIAMYLQCLKERRQFALVKFASNAKLWPIPESLTRLDISFLESIERQGYLGGGTNFQSAWNVATQFIRTNKAWQQADIVYVTDGIGGYNVDQFRKDISELSVRLISFFIDPDNDIQRYMSTRYGDMISGFVNLNDAFTHIQDLSERGERQAFELIRKKNVKGHFSVVNGKLTETKFEQKEEELTF